MANRYISKNKDGKWAITNSKTGKALRTADTQKEAIALAGAMKSTETIMIKRSAGWQPATGWDQQVANITKTSATKKPAAKKPAAKKTAAKPAAKKTAAKPAAKKTAAKPAAKKTAAKPAAKKTATKPATKKTAAKPAAKKTAAKPAAKKTATKKAPVKSAAKKEEAKPATKKAPAKKAPAKKAASKPVAKKEKVDKVDDNSSKELNTQEIYAPVKVVKEPRKTKDGEGSIPGILGFFIGMVIIAFVIAAAFLIGYFVL